MAIDTVDTNAVKKALKELSAKIDELRGHL